MQVSTQYWKVFQGFSCRKIFFLFSKKCDTSLVLYVLNSSEVIDFEKEQLYLEKFCEKADDIETSPCNLAYNKECFKNGHSKEKSEQNQVAFSGFSSRKSDKFCTRRGHEMVS